MKKIFSAFLLMTMMVASVGSFVSCSDIEESIAQVENTANNNATAIESLKSEVAALKTAVTAAQSAADAAMAAAKDAAAAAKAAQATGDAAAAAAATAQAEAAAAKAAAEQAKADALAAVATEVAALETEINAAMEAMKTANATEIETIKAAIAKLQEDAAAQLKSVEALSTELATVKDALVKYEANLEELGILTAENKAKIEENVAAIATLEEKVAALEKKHADDVKALQDAIAALNVDETLADVAKINSALVALQDRLQSVSYVPEWAEGPKAVLFTENKDYGYVHMSFEVAPKEYAAKITAENTKLVGVSLTKAVEVEEHDVKILSADPETGIVEVIGYIDVESTVWDNDAAALALRVVAEDAQVTSAYTNVEVKAGADYSINNAVYFGVYNEDGDFVYKTSDDGKLTINHKVAYDTAVDESEVALFEGLVARVHVPGFFEYVPVEEAAEMFGFDIKVTEKVSSYATKYFVTTNNKVYDFVKDANKTPDTPAFVVANDETLDITVKFSKTVVDSLVKAETLTSYVGNSANAVLKPGYFRVNDKKAENLKGITANYTVGGLEQTIELIVEDAMVEWTPENAKELAASNFITVKDLDVTGDDARELEDKLDETSWTYKSLDENVVAPTIAVDFISVDNADLKVYVTKWPEVETTYNYTVTGKYEEEGETTVIVKFDLAVTVEAAPEQIGEVPASAVTVNLVKSGIEVKPGENPWPKTTVALTGVVEKILPYYKEYFETEKKAKEYIVTELKKAKEVAIRVAGKTTGELGDALTFANNKKATYTYSVNDAKVETSAITIPYDATVYAAMSKQYVQFSFDVNIFGIVATVTADCAEVSEWVEYTAPTIALEMGKFDPKTLKGANPFIWSNVADQWTETVNGKTVYHDYNYVEVKNAADKSDTKPDNYAFGGDALNLADYVKIVNEGTADLTNDYTLRISMSVDVDYETGVAPNKVPHYYYNEYVDPVTNQDVIPTLTNTRAGWTVDMFETGAVSAAAKVEDVTYNGVEIDLPAITAVAAGKVNTAVWVVPASDLEYLVFDWNGSKYNNITVNVELIKANYNDPYIKRYPAIDVEPVQFMTPKAATLEAVETEAYEFVHGQNLEIKLAKHIKVTDLFGKQINNPYGTWAQIWNQFVWSEYTTNPKPTVAEPGTYGIGTTDFFNVYGQSIQFVNLRDAEGKEIVPATNIKNNNGFVPGDYTFANGVITLNGNLANISRETTFTVAVEFSHINSGFKPEYKEISVKVVNAAE